MPTKVAYINFETESFEISQYRDMTKFEILAKCLIMGYLPYIWPHLDPVNEGQPPSRA